MSYLITVVAIVFGVVGIDQLTKYLTVLFLDVGQSVPLWQDVLHFTYVQNKGMAFGLLAEHRWVFMILSTIAIVGLLFYMVVYRPQNRWVQVSLSMIIGGGIGNMIDRIVLGYVVDFIDFTLINFAVFNVADSFVCIGAGMIVVYLLWDIIRDVKKTNNKVASVEDNSNEE